MSKTFRTIGSGSTQTTEPIENNKIPVYDTKTDAEADLANLTVGQIIATKDEGNETSNPVDVIEDGNMHAATSNAVAKEIQPLKKSYVLESGVFSPTVIAGNDHINTTIQLQHTYSFDDIAFMLTPVTYTNTAFITVSGHWGGSGESSEGWTQSDKITVFVTNLYAQSQTAGFYWAIYGTEDNVVS